MKKKVKRGILICPCCGQSKFVDENSWERTDNDELKHLLEKVKQGIFIKYDVKCPDCNPVPEYN